MKVSCSIKTAIWSTLVVLLIVSGVALLCTKDDIFSYIYNSQLVLSATSGSFPMWSVLPEPMIASMYLWEVKNPEAFSKGAKPVLEERGPYVFTEQHYKTNITWNDNNGTVTYKQIRKWNFVPELSNGTLEDKVTIFNPVPATLASMVKDNKFFQTILSGFLKGWKEQLFVTKPVHEIIFDGFHDPVFDNLEDLIEALPFIKQFIPEGSLMDKFAFFYNRNGTDYVDGVWNMFTGAGDNSKMGQVNTWNYTTNPGYWNGSCGQVKGGAGEFYPPGLQKTFIELYSNDLCRTLRFNFAQEVDVKGINSYEYVADKSFFANGTMNPANKCFDSQDIPSGLFDSSACRFGAPVFISQPHFYQADTYYLDKIQSGLTPNSSLHATVFRVEPRSGVPTDVTARFQLNVLVEPLTSLTMFEKVPLTYFPVMWFENKAGVPDSLVFKMKLMANLQEIIGGIGWVQIGGALAILIISMIVISARKKEEDQRPILSQSLHDDIDQDQEDDDEKLIEN